MRNRILQITVLAFLFAFAPHIVSPIAPPVVVAEAAEAGDDKAAFRVAYKAYQAAVEAKDADAAEAAAHEALELGESIFPDDSPSLAALHVNYGMALVDTKRAKDAMKPLRSGIKRYEELYGKKDERLIDPLWSLADAHSGVGERSEEGKVRARLLRLVEEINGRDSLIFAEANLELGKSYYLGYENQRRARRYIQEAYDAYGRFFGQPAYKTGVAAFWLGKAAQQRRKRDTAEKRFLEALEIFEKTAPPGHNLQLLAHTYLIKLYEDRGRSEEANLHCQAISRLRPLAGVDGYTPLYKKYPIYPRTAQIAGRSGYVLVEFSVTAIGTVANATVVEFGGGRRKEFQRAALKAVEGFRYAPAVEDGKLVETTGVRNLITFEIDD